MGMYECVCKYFQRISTAYNSYDCIVDWHDVNVIIISMIIVSENLRFQI